MTRQTRLLPSKSAQSGVVLIISLILLIALTLGGISLFRQVGTGVLVARNVTFQSSALVSTDRGAEAARNWLVTSGADLEQGNLAAGYYPGWCHTTMIDPANGDPLIPDADGNGLVDDCKAAPAPSFFDPPTFNWANSVLATPDDGNGNAIRYVIHRLCRLPGSMNGTINISGVGVPQECVTVGGSTSGASLGAVSYGNQALTNTTQPYFRVTVQATGPSNTIAYSQVILY